MLEDLFRRPRVRRANPPKSHRLVLEEFVEYLIARGYRTEHDVSVRLRRRALWAVAGATKHQPRSGPAVSQAAFAVVPVQHASAAEGSEHHRAALNRLVGNARSRMRPRRPRVSFSESLLRRYADHLTQVQGLAPVTVHYRLRYARAMLSSFRVQRLRAVEAVDGRSDQAVRGPPGPAWLPSQWAGDRLVDPVLPSFPPAAPTD